MILNLALSAVCIDSGLIELLNSPQESRPHSQSFSSTKIAQLKCKPLTMSSIKAIATSNQYKNTSIWQTNLTYLQLATLPKTTPLTILHWVLNSS